MPNPDFFPLPNWSPLFEAPPHLFTECTSIVLLCRAPKGVLKDLLPLPLAPAQDEADIFHVAFMKNARNVMPTHIYPDTKLVDFGIPVTFDGINGRHCTLEYFDTDFGMAAGRELYGWPKKLARFSWQDRADGSVHIEVQRDGHTLVMFDFKATDVKDETDWASIMGIPEDAPSLQVRAAERTASEPKRLDVVRQDIGEVVVHSSTPGRASLRLFDGPTDPLSFLGPVEILSARMDRYDFVFNWGEIIATVDLPDNYAEAQLALSYELRKRAGFAVYDNKISI